MPNIKTPDSNYLIPISMFDICLIDNKTKKEITALYPKRTDGVYYLNKFINYLDQFHKIQLRDYCINYLQVNWPKCLGCNDLTNFNVSGKGVIISQYHRAKNGGSCVTKETCQTFKKGCEKLSLERMGQNNPAFGLTPWNKGLDNNDPRIKAISEKRIGAVTPEDVKVKQSISAKKRKVHGHTGFKHTDQLKEKMRHHTARLWASGAFSKETSIHKAMREFLSTLDLNFELKEEFQVKYFSMDFAFPEIKVAIECQGSYFHVDPRIYPNGPKTAVQKRNFGRDKVKRKVCCEYEGWVIIEVWEPEIKDNSFKEELICKLRELKILKE